MNKKVLIILFVILFTIVMFFAFIGLSSIYEKINKITFIKSAIISIGVSVIVLITNRKNIMKYIKNKNEH